MSNVNGVSSIVGDKYAYKNEARKVDQNMDKDAFLNLLVTQLKYQDPLQPTQDKEFIAQMAQFTSLEQMQNMNRSMQMSQGYALVGKHVQGNYYNETAHETQLVEGTVESIKMKEGKVYALVDGKDIEVSKIQEVTDPAKDMATKNTAMAQAFNMIGKAVKAEVFNKETEEFEDVTGIVGSVKVKDGSIVALIGDKEINIDKIKEIGESLSSAAGMETLDQMRYLNKETQTLQAYTLMGKNVTGKIPAKEATETEEAVEEKTVSGTVEGVEIENGNVFVKIGNERLNVSYITSVTN